MGSSCSQQQVHEKSPTPAPTIATGYQVVPSPEVVTKPTVESNFNMMMKNFQENNVCMKCQLRQIICTPETIKVDMTMSYNTCTHCNNKKT